jgi:hypothetical protein
MQSRKRLDHFGAPSAEFVAVGGSERGQQSSSLARQFDIHMPAIAAPALFRD